MFSNSAGTVSRRRALVIASLAAAGAVTVVLRPAGSDNGSSANADVTVVEYDDAGRKLRTATRKKVIRSDGDWRRQLTTQQYWSARRGTTDTPFTGTYYRIEAGGLFRCVCCQSPLFSSETKFDSATGWPSFSAPIAAENIWTQSDRSLAEERVEILCRLCDAHLGHVFDDGPPPSGLRYCLNESALRFIPRAT